MIINRKRITEDNFENVLAANEGFTYKVNYSGNGIKLSTDYEIKDGKLYWHEKGKAIDRSGISTYEQTMEFLRNHKESLTITA